MISRLPFLLVLPVLTGCGPQDTSTCADRIKKRLVAPATLKILDSSKLQPAALSLADYKNAMAQTADEFKAESDKASTEAERIAADSALAYMRGLKIDQEYVRDLEKGSDIS